LQDVDTLREELRRYNIEKDELRDVKARLLIVEEKHRGLRWENEVSKG